MLHLGSRRGVRPRTLSRFVRIDATLDAPADRGAQAGHRCKCVGEDQLEDARQCLDVIDDNANRHHDVTERHERHDDLRKVRDSFYAAEDDHAKDHDDKTGRYQLRRADAADRCFQGRASAECEFHGGADGVRLDGRKQ